MACPALVTSHCMILIQEGTEINCGYIYAVVTRYEHTTH